ETASASSSRKPPTKRRGEPRVGGNPAVLSPGRRGTGPDGRHHPKRGERSGGGGPGTGPGLAADARAFEGAGFAQGRRVDRSAGGRRHGRQADRGADPHVPSHPLVGNRRPLVVVRRSAGGGDRSESAHQGG